MPVVLVLNDLLSNPDLDCILTPNNDLTRLSAFNTAFANNCLASLNVSSGKSLRNLLTSARFLTSTLNSSDIFIPVVMDVFHCLTFSLLL